LEVIILSEKNVETFYITKPTLSMLNGRCEKILNKGIMYNTNYLPLFIRITTHKIYRLADFVILAIHEFSIRLSYVKTNFRFKKQQ
jgi:hypothetical protein